MRQDIRRIRRHSDVFMANGEPATLDQWAVPRALRGETATNAEYTLRRKDTGETWVGSYSFGPIRDKDGVIVGAVVAGRDITDRKREQDALRQADFCVQHAGDGIFWIDSEGRIVFANQKASEVLEYSCEELQSMTVFDIDAILTREQWGPHWVAIRQEKSFVFESRHRTKTGKIVPVEISVNYMTFDGKEYNCAIARDVTDRKRAEESLRASEERLTGIIQNAAEIIYTLSLDGVLTFVSPSWTQVLGHDISEVEGRTFVPFIHPDDVAVCQAAIKGVSCHGETAAWHVPYSPQRWKLAVASLGWLLNQGPTRPPGWLGRSGARRHRTQAC